MNIAPPPAVIKLRTEEFRKRAQAAGLDSDDEVADRLGVNRTTVWRVLNGQARPGESFIAATLAAFPHTGFDDVFELVVGGDS